MSWTRRQTTLEGLHFNHRETVTSPKPPDWISSRSRNRVEKALMPPHRPQAAASEHNDRACAAVTPQNMTHQGEAVWGHCPNDMQLWVSEGSLEIRKLESSHHNHRVVTAQCLCLGHLVVTTKFTSLLTFPKVAIYNYGNASFQFFITFL